MQSKYVLLNDKQFLFVVDTTCICMGGIGKRVTRVRSEPRRIFETPEEQMAALTANDALQTTAETEGARTSIGIDEAAIVVRKTEHSWAHLAVDRSIDR